jgi:calcineurin-like phosphoesterase family protein
MEMYLSDTHLGHENIRAHCRPMFPDVETMNRTIIDNINARMTRRDTLYLLGDFAYRSATPVTEYLEAIRPKPVLLVGNHDGDWLRRLTEDEKSRYFAGIYPTYGFKKHGIEVHMNHYPMLAWSRSHFFAQSFSVCGHIHNTTQGKQAAELFPPLKCQFNAGADINGFAPVTFEELVRNNTAFYGREYTREEQELLDGAVRKVMG